jgi:hypothetical protein
MPTTQIKEGDENWRASCIQTLKPKKSLQTWFNITRQLSERNKPYALIDMSNSINWIIAARQLTVRNMI